MNFFPNLPLLTPNSSDFNLLVRLFAKCVTPVWLLFFKRLSFAVKLSSEGPSLCRCWCTVQPWTTAPVSATSFWRSFSIRQGSEQFSALPDLIMTSYHLNDIQKDMGTGETLCHPFFFFHPSPVLYALLIYISRVLDNCLEEFIFAR